ncbi:MAG: 16S rRNA (cytosine(1402)-N(4))-methyltransferase RsmH [Dehalococcoidia bacterium]|nr:16S rRNA (cytosine(1402)-N(4))-methyltransferase RsmH [Dehalococcoidia bacterium]
MSSQTHIPVLSKEVIEYLAVQPGGRYIDCTLGGGGHAAAILEHSSPGGQLLGIDADPDAIETARKRLAPYRDSVLLIDDNFVNLRDICLRYDFFPVHGILFDLGLSTFQLESKRGFSFQHDSLLDMRFSPNQKTTAGEIVNTYPEAELARIIKTYGEEIFAQKIARHIVQSRPVRTTLELAEVIERALGGRKGRIHPATRTFQALRIVVNRELDNLESALKQSVDLLGFGGRLIVISYHSLEDRIVKRFMQKESKDCICPPEVPECRCGHRASLKIVTKKIITPSPEEVEYNPRSRSARLRAAERVISPNEQYEKAFEQLNCSIGVVPSGSWRRPALVEKLRKTFTSLQINNFTDAVMGRFKM